MSDTSIVANKGTKEFVSTFMNQVRLKNEGQPEFHQAVEEIIETIAPFYLENKVYQDNKILERLINPDRIIVFRVVWEDDKGEIHVNRGYRVQFNNSIGPYKGGLRFHKSVNLGVLKFLAFEQIFKNSLTTLPLGGGKGGSDFDPKGKSDREVMRFCQAFAAELGKYVGASQDVPAGDIGVGGREIGYLFGAIKKMKGEYTGVLTGKGMSFGGSNIRPEATGYGAVYFMKEMLTKKGDSMNGKKVLISGSGNVAQYAAEKCLELGATVLTLSDSGGTIYDADGIDTAKLAFVMDLKNNKRGRISEYVKQYPNAKYMEGQRPWSISCDIAFPCATQNELNGADAKTLLGNGCIGVAEGANMPSDLDAVHVFLDAKILYGPGKAANAGGVAVSGLEMAQNSQRMIWTREETDEKLKSIMKDIHSQCVKYGTREDGSVDYVTGANVAGFVKVADAMVAFGIH
ncbi:MAG: glutamate dehydrogenase (NADP+) [Flavobacteriales bacterium]|jgi:glutamate dehydrogenase (NADP+)